MALFKKKDDTEWNIWDDDYDDVPLYEEKIEEASYDYEDVSPGKMSRQKFKKPKEKNMDYDDRTLREKRMSRRELRKQEKINEEIEYFSNSDNLYAPKASLSYGKVITFVVFLLIASLGILGFLNTDFDKNNKAYVVSFDIHYERDYVNESDELLNYLINLENELPRLLQSLNTSPIAVSEEISNIITIVDAKTNGTSNYTRVPVSMKSYNNTLITTGMKTKEMLETALANYTSMDYYDWSEKAYYDYCDTIKTLKTLRTEIDTIIHRNMTE